MKHLEHLFSEKLLLTTSRYETVKSSNSVREYSDTIPVDLLINILSLVPAKSIARFRCVSKFWAFILRRQDFTELFLTKSCTRPRFLFTVEADGKLFFYSTPQPQHPDDNSSLVASRYHTSVPKYIPSDTPSHREHFVLYFPKSSHAPFYIYSPSDICAPVCGLIFLQGWRRSQVRVICNPAKGKVLILPKLPKEVKTTSYTKAEGMDKIAGMYFGYDPIGKQFKVLCMTSSGHVFKPNTHWVLSLESGKRLWRPVERKFHFRVTSWMRGYICINGFLYFGGYSQWSWVIICFDVRSEKFCLINNDVDIPLGPVDLTSSLALFNYKGKLGLIQLREREEVVLWLLVDAASNKWSKHIYVLNPLGKSIVTENKFVGMTDTGELMWSSYWSHDLSNHFDVFFYNLERNTFARVNIEGFGHHSVRRIHTFIDYVENMKFMVCIICHETSRAAVVGEFVINKLQIRNTIFKLGKRVDLLIDIFSLLPAKSIARFCCVSKFWASILRRSDFTELFLTKSLTRPRLFFALESDGKLFFYSTLQPHNPDDNSSLVATPYHTSFPEYFPCDIYAPVCGLVLLQAGWRRERRKVRVVCNPATGEFITLSKVLLREKNLLAKDTEARDKIERMYLGYDPKGKQFKVLCMTTTCSFYEVRDNTHQVLTLGPGKLFWRQVERKFHFVENPVIWREVCINGVLYFGAGFDYSSMIVCFNVGSEKFSFVNTNEEMRYSSSMGSLTSFNYKDRLGIHRREKSYQNRIVFWVLEDAENHKWSKHIYELSPLEKDMIKYSSFVGMTSTGEFVWSSLSYNGPPHSHYLTFYNLESETFTKVNIQGRDEFKQHRSLSTTTYLDYVENVKWLVSHKPLPTEPPNAAASGSKSEKPNSIQKPSPTALSANDKNRGWEEKSRGKRRIATSSKETRCGPALSNRFAALDSLEDAGYITL